MEDEKIYYFISFLYLKTILKPGYTPVFTYKEFINEVNEVNDILTKMNLPKDDLFLLKKDNCEPLMATVYLNFISFRTEIIKLARSKGGIFKFSEIFLKERFTILITLGVKKIPLVEYNEKYNKYFYDKKRNFNDVIFGYDLINYFKITEPANYSEILDDLFKTQTTEETIAYFNDPKRTISLHVN